MKPSEAIAQGKCPSCLGIGWVHRVVPMEHEGPCSTCLGTGLWPPDEVQLIDGDGCDIPGCDHKRSNRGYDMRPTDG